MQTETYKPVRLRVGARGQEYAKRALTAKSPEAEDRKVYSLRDLREFVGYAFERGYDEGWDEAQSGGLPPC
jgi:hypothetical protein